MGTHRVAEPKAEQWQPGQQTGRRARPANSASSRIRCCNAARRSPLHPVKRLDSEAPLRALTRHAVRELMQTPTSGCGPAPAAGSPPSAAVEGGPHAGLGTVGGLSWRAACDISTGRRLDPAA